MSEEKIFFVRGKKQVMKSEASAIDLKNELIDNGNLSDQQNFSSKLNKSLSILSMNDDGKLIAVYPDGRRELVAD